MLLHMASVCCHTHLAVLEPLSNAVCVVAVVAVQNTDIIICLKFHAAYCAPAGHKTLERHMFCTTFEAQFCKFNLASAETAACLALSEPLLFAYGIHVFNAHTHIDCAAKRHQGQSGA